MKATGILSEEHRVIELVLECLDRIVEQSESRGKLEGEPARDVLAFLAGFADRCHHMKEETHLFPAMEAKFLRGESGTTEVMVYEHNVTRYRARGMEQALEAACQGRATAVRRFVRHARAYNNLLRNHIQIEDHCVYAMANRAFTAEDQHNLLVAFEKVDADEIGETARQRYLEIAARLAARFGLAWGQVGDCETPYRPYLPDSAWCRS